LDGNIKRRIFEPSLTAKPHNMNYKGTKLTKLAITIGNILRGKKYGKIEASLALRLGYEYAEQIIAEGLEYKVVRFYSKSEKRNVSKVVLMLPTNNRDFQNYEDLILRIRGANSFRRYKTCLLKKVS
jgi:hypothetical protein